MNSLNYDHCEEFLYFLIDCTLDDGQDLMESIEDAICGGCSTSFVSVRKTYTYHPEIPGGEYQGTIEIGDHSYWFRYESSNIRGSVMLAWSE